jgi:hypothetical protein
MSGAMKKETLIKKIKKWRLENVDGKNNRK